MTISANDKRLIERAQKLAQRIAELRAAYQAVSFGEEHEEITTYPYWSEVVVPLKAVYEFAIETQAISPQTSDDDTTKWIRLVAERATSAYEGANEKGKIDGLVDNYVLWLLALEDGGKPNLDFQEPESPLHDPELAIDQLVNVFRPCFDQLSLTYQETPLSLTVVQFSGELTGQQALSLIPDWYRPMPHSKVQQMDSASKVWLPMMTYYGPSVRDPNEGPWRHYYFATEDLAAHAAYRKVAVKAARCLGDWAASIGVNLDTLSTDDALGKWNYALFDLAWHWGVSFPIDATPIYLQREKLFERRTMLDRVGDDSQAKLVAEIAVAALEQQGFYAHIDDVLLASILAIDVLAKQCARTVQQPVIENVVAKRHTDGNDSIKPPQDAQNLATEKVAEKKRIVDGLTPSVRLAYQSYKLAECDLGEGIPDQEAYDGLKNGDLLDASYKWAGLEKYKLPSYETWERYLRIARNALGEQKYSPRAERSFGRSVVKEDQI